MVIAMMSAKPLCCWGRVDNKASATTLGNRCNCRAWALRQIGAASCRDRVFMTERTFRIVFASVLLIALYCDLHYVVYGLIALSVFQGVTPWRISRLTMHLRPGPRPHSESVRPDAAPGTARVDFEAERALSLLTAAVLALGSVLFARQLWFLPWFIGFAFFGAGLSGICPLVMCFRWVGLK